MRTMWGATQYRGGAMAAAALIAAAGLLATMPAQAANILTLDFIQMTNPPVTPDVANQLRVDIQQTGDSLDFLFLNLDLEPSVGSRVTHLYMGDSFRSFLDFGNVSAEDWVYEEIDLDKPNQGNVSPPHPGGGMASMLWEFRAAGGGGAGIEVGESLLVSFNLLDPDNFNFGSLSGGFTQQNLFIALRVQGIEGGSPGDSAQFLTGVPTGGDPPQDPAVVPVPPAAGLGLVGFALIGWTNLRKRFSS